MKILVIVFALGALLAVAMVPGPHGKVFAGSHGDYLMEGRAQDRLPSLLEAVQVALWGVPFSLLQGIGVAVVLIACYIVFV